MLKQKLTIFVPSLRGGGAERIMVILANGFIRRGIRVDLVLSKAEGPYLDDLSSEVKVIDLRSRGVLFSLYELVKYLGKERPSALLSAMGHTNVVAVIAGMLAGGATRVVISERNHYSVSTENAKNNIVRRKILNFVRPWAYSRADGIVAISCGVADDIAENLGLNRSEIDVVYNPALAPNLLPLSLQNPDHHWFRQDSAPVILGTGRLTPQKDFITLIKAFEMVYQQRDVKLLILGEGHLRGEIEAMIKKMGLQNVVELVGYVRNPYSYMRNAALFVLSSRWEGFGNVIVESMACGTPVVSTDCPSGPAEILENGKWGRLVPVGDKTALASAILTTLDEAKHPDVVERSRDFSVEKGVDGYFNVLFPG